jgi:aerobic carbon-monoxide dehydrogenase medium subunit
VFPASFEYVAPGSLDEALSLLTEHRDDAKVLAGGQSLIPLMKLRFAAPALLVDINRIPGLDVLEEDRNDGGALRIGALVRTSTLERSPLLASRYPTLAAAAPLISDPIVRNQGTLVGSVCHADPQGDWASTLLALGGEVVARSSKGERRVPMTEFLDGPFTSVLQPDEIAVEVRVPGPNNRDTGTYLKLERKVGDFATVGVAVALSMSGDTVERAGIGLTGVGATNLKAVEAERSLIGRQLTDEAIGEAARLAADASDPQSDIRGTADYKRHVVRVYVARGLRQAIQGVR